MSYLSGCKGLERNCKLQILTIHLRRINALLGRFAYNDLLMVEGLERLAFNQTPPQWKTLRL